MKETELYAPQIDAIIEGPNPENNPMTLAMCLKLSHVFRSSLFCAKPGTKTILNRAMVLIRLRVKLRRTRRTGIIGFAELVNSVPRCLHRF